LSCLQLNRYYPLILDHYLLIRHMKDHLLNSQVQEVVHQNKSPIHYNLIQYNKTDLNTDSSILD
jgi:adenine C2-methylase RlmN of 23S rRNA A2503 and tRNA A37